MAKTTKKPVQAGHAIHWMMQAKGGVGKSTCASFLLQYLQGKGRTVQGLDVDPSNHTLKAYKALPVTVVDLIEDEEINPRLFDAAMVRMLNEASDFVIDTGSSGFVPLWNYVVQNRVMELIRKKGRSVYLHTVVAGGGPLLETLSSMKSLATTVGEQEMIVWANEREAKVQIDGKKLWEMAAYQESESKILGTVLVEKRLSTTFGADMARMISEKRTFAEALNGSGYNMMEQQRLTWVWNDLVTQLDELPFA